MGKTNKMNEVPMGLNQVWAWQDANRRHFAGNDTSISIHAFLCYAAKLPLNLEQIAPYNPPVGRNDTPVALKQVWEWKDSCCKTVESLLPNEAIHALLENACRVAEHRNEYKKGPDRKIE